MITTPELVTDQQPAWLDLPEVYYYCEGYSLELEEPGTFFGFCIFPTQSSALLYNQVVDDPFWVWDGKPPVMVTMNQAISIAKDDNCSVVEVLDYDNGEWKIIKVVKV